MSTTFTFKMREALATRLAQAATVTGLAPDDLIRLAVAHLMATIEAGGGLIRAPRWTAAHEKRRSMSEWIRIKTNAVICGQVAAAANRLRCRPEDIWLLGAGEVTRYVERHGYITIPCVSLAPETGSVLRRAVSATGAFVHEADLAEHLLAGAIERFKAGDYSLITDSKGDAS